MFFQGRSHSFNGKPEATALGKHSRLRLAVKQFASIHEISLRDCSPLACASSLYLTSQYSDQNKYQQCNYQNSRSDCGDEHPILESAFSIEFRMRIEFIRDFVVRVFECSIDSALLLHLFGLGGKRRERLLGRQPVFPILAPNNAPDSYVALVEVLSHFFGS